MQIVKNLGVIGQSLKEFLWLVEHSGSPGADGLCLVNRGEPVRQKSIAADLRKTKTSVVKNLRKLEESNLLFRELRPGKPSSYKIKIDW